MVELFESSEASTRTCPVSMAVGNANNARTLYCRGQQCMAWRWATRPDPEDACRNLRTDFGYCGMVPRE